MLYKPDGRVGSAACYGAGCWAAKGVGATASGTGEQLIQAQLPRRVSEELIRARRKRSAASIMIDSDAGGAGGSCDGRDSSSSGTVATTQPGRKELFQDGDMNAEAIIGGIMQDFAMNRDGEESPPATRDTHADSQEPAVGGVLVLRQKGRDAQSDAVATSDSPHTGSSTCRDDRVQAVGDFEIVWSHNSHSFAVAYLTAQMDSFRVPPRCVFSRIRETAASPEKSMRYASRDVSTTCASVT